MAKILSQVGEHRPRPRKTVRGCKQKTFSCSNTKKFKKRSVTSKVTVLSRTSFIFQRTKREITKRVWDWCRSRRGKHIDLTGELNLNYHLKKKKQF